MSWTPEKSKILREYAHIMQNEYPYRAELMSDAADALEAQQAELAELRVLRKDYEQAKRAYDTLRAGEGEGNK